MEEPPVLVGVRTRLRSWRADDAPAIHAACQDPDIQRFTTVPSPYRYADAEWFLAHHVHDVAAEGGRAFAVEALGEPGLAGSMALLHARPEPDRGVVGEIGYWTAPWARGRGWTADALGVVVAWAFAERAVDRLELLIDPENAASRAVARRAGFAEEHLDPAHVLRDGSVRALLVHGLHARDRG
ncbi:GNAT family N-acetyltransferase [Actinomycetospora sp. TBRC 11914]|uniref:GNAT family N-acetyltransferase n=1 Tax=Actinomycetospora sp. TBRC 11914 TaxID=2729387 RepID=UPI00145E1CB3|nr:GNAT family protein [Actinomycetospora sp. TBRC 11914]NMO89291.1 GNAT family N-acetyltransferase [Actinomycetospora sp. TBRC 11914]